MEPVIAEHIERRAELCGGKPCIAGHRIRVQDIVVWHEMQGQAPEEIVTRFPQITLADVYAALAYYHDHREEISQEIQEEKAFVAAMRASSPSKLLQKLAGTEADGDSLPPG